MPKFVFPHAGCCYSICTYRRISQHLSLPVLISIPGPQSIYKGQHHWHFFPLFYPPEKLSPRQERDPFNCLKGWAGNMTRISKMDALPTFPQGRKWSGGFSRCPLSLHHMDSVGIWQINLVKVALASQPHPSAQTFSPQWSFIDCREISWRQHIIKAWVLLKVSEFVWE